MPSRPIEPVRAVCLKSFMHEEKPVHHGEIIVMKPHTFRMLEHARLVRVATSADLAPKPPATSEAGTGAKAPGK